MTATIRVPIPLLEEIETALNEAVRFKYRGKLQNNSYSLVAMIGRYRQYTSPEGPVDEYRKLDPTSSADQCPKCGTRSEPLEGPGTLPSDTWCPKCGYTYSLMERDK